MTTASHSFSGRRPVSPATRERVWQAAFELGFVPHSGPGNIAVLLRPPEALPASTFGTTSFANLAGAVALGLLGRGFSVVTARELNDVVGSVARLDGCVLLYPNHADASLRTLLRGDIPTVSYDPDPGTTDFRWWVGVDYYHSIAALVAHMFDRGVRRLAMLVGQTDNMYRRSMLAAYTSAVEHLRAKPVIRVADNARGQEAAAEVTAELLSSVTPRPDAIITSSSVFAAGVLSCSARMGVAVPDELRLATVTDGPLAEFAPVPITALRIDTHKSAQQLIELLDLRINRGPVPNVNPHVQLELIRRRSTW